MIAVAGVIIADIGSNANVQGANSILGGLTTFVGTSVNGILGKAPGPVNTNP
jgi:hypothetical protein